jgi:hypothetical protein
MEEEKDTKKLTTKYRMGQWAEIMQERVDSGLSIVKYCEREGMPTNRYHYWQRRLRAVAKELIPVNTEAIAPVPSGWTQVTTAEENPQNVTLKSQDISEVKIEIGKCKVTANDETNTELLTKVCKALMSIC